MTKRDAILRGAARAAELHYQFGFREPPRANMTCYTYP
jgi:hypothetical protein